MDKPSNKKPIIPEMDIPDVADYQPSDSAFTKFGIRTYILMRTKPRFFAGSLFALALTAGAIGIIAFQANQKTVDFVEFQSAELSGTQPTPSPQLTDEFDDRIERSDNEELRTSIKPLELPEDISVDTEPSPPTPTTVSRLEVTAIPLNQQKGIESEVPSQHADENTSINVFSERFGNEQTDVIGAEQAALTEALTRIGTLEQSVEKLKSFPFDMIVNPEVDSPRYAILRIAEGAEETSGFWREVEDAEKKQTREEYFLIVNTVDEETGESITVDVTDMDSGEMKKETSWAVLTDMNQFLSFAENKNEDGTFSDPILGKLNLETGEIEWNIVTDGKALINWKEFAE